jgi:U3 small nucleolar RNA-associated protein 20
LFEELRAVTIKDAGAGSIDPLPSWADGNLDGDNLDDPWEEERTWRDPSAHKLRATVAKWVTGSEFLLADLRKVRAHCRADLW